MDESNLRKVLNALDIRVVNKSGKWLEFKCPFAPWTHRKKTDTRPSCAAVIDQGRVSNYKCHSCKKHGRISSLVRSLEFYRQEKYPGLAFEADMADASASFGDFELPDEEPDELPPPLNEAAFGNLYDSAWDIAEARAYLKGRGIGKDTVQHLELGYDPDDMRIIFPVRHTDGRLYGFTGRSIIKDPADYPYKNYPKVRDYHGLPKRHLLLGAHLVDAKKPNFVIEGLFGYAHLMEIRADDIVNPLALLGSEMTEHKAAILRDMDSLTVLAPDNDEAGDACLFGTWDEKIEKFAGGGAVDLLAQHIPLIIPHWPDKADGTQKDDPDQLTLAEVKTMAFDTPLFSLTKKQKPTTKKWE